MIDVKTLKQIGMDELIKELGASETDLVFIGRNLELAKVPVVASVVKTYPKEFREYDVYLKEKLSKSEIWNILQDLGYGPARAPIGNNADNPLRIGFGKHSQNVLYFYRPT